MLPGRCAECGFRFGSDRASLMDRCDRFPQVLEGLLQSVDVDRVRRRPAVETWAPIEYAAHVAEALRWYAARIRRVLDEDLPQLESFDFDAAAQAGEYHSLSVEEVSADVYAACRELADVARSVSVSQLARSGIGSDRSPRSVELLLARAHHELVHHEQDVRRGLNLVRPAPRRPM